MTDTTAGEGVELKPCPFCGSENLNAVFHRLHGVIECLDCGVTLPLPEKSPETQASRWNERHNFGQEGSELKRIAYTSEGELKALEDKRFGGQSISIWTHPTGAGSFALTSYDTARRLIEEANALAAQPSAGAQREAVAWLIEWQNKPSEGVKCPGGGSEIIRNQYAAVVGKVKTLEGISWVDTVKVTPLAALYATPAQPDTGYTDAFYQLAEMMGLPASPQSPRTVWETVMRPRLQELLAQPDTGDVAALREALATVDAMARSGAAMSAADYSISAERLGESIYKVTTPILAALSKPNAPGREG